ncbi:hypothetical protein V8B55DRAFT_1325942 [Mucor lusitanicus]
MTRAIARQDEALEDLIRSTRQVIRKHSTYLAHTNDHDDYSFHRRRNHGNHKPRLPPPLPPPVQTQCSHHCCESITRPIPPKTHHHYHVQPHQPPPPPPPPPPQQQQPSYQPQPFPTKSRTKTWLNKIIPSKLQCETDDEIGLHDLKKKIYKQRPKLPLPPPPPPPEQQLPSVKTTGRPMIIPSVASSPEKVVVLDVPADTTVILRSIDADDPNSKQTAAIHHITDMNIIHQLFGHIQMTESKSTGDIKVQADNGIKKMSKSHTMQLGSIQTGHFPPNNSGPNSSSSTLSAATIVNAHERSHQQQLPQKKPKGMARYMSMPTQLSLKAQEFHYMDSDASTVDHCGEHSPSSMSSTASSLYHHHYNDDRKTSKQERVALPHHTRGWMR